MSKSQQISGFDLHDVEEEDHWISVSDLMAGLMMVFLFISVALMRNAFLERDKIVDVAEAYKKTQVAIYQALQVEFKDDLVDWGAAIDPKTLSFEFQSPDVLFAMGKTTLRARFEDILDDFFPRYMGVIDQFSQSITEVRIEGHTSSVWNQNTSADNAYFLNMNLSQGRTRSVLRHVYNLDKVISDRPWIKKHVAAVGLSSSQRRMNPDESENYEKSRRVTFRIITNAEDQIRKILEL